MSSSFTGWDTLGALLLPFDLLLASGEVALKLVNVSLQLGLLSGLIVQSCSECVELFGADSGLGGARSSWSSAGLWPQLPTGLAAVFSAVVTFDGGTKVCSCLLFLNEFVWTQYTRREDAFTYIFGVVGHSLKLVFTVYDNITVALDSIVVSKDWIQDVLPLFRFRPDLLVSSKTVECVVSWPVAS